MPSDITSDSDDMPGQPGPVLPDPASDDVFGLSASTLPPAPPALLPGHCEVWALISLCLSYPDEALLAARSQLAGAADALPLGSARSALRRFTDWFAAVPEQALTVEYVRTFDMRRDTSLNLTYHSHGETRRRGLALLELKRRLRACGMVPEDTELPDHLPLLLEVAAVDPEHGTELLRLVRPGIEMLHRGLAGTPYRHLLDALVVTLGPADTTTSAVVDELVVLGPPVEDVGAGFDPEAGPGLDAAFGPGLGTAAPPCAGPSDHVTFLPEIRSAKTRSAQARSAQSRSAQERSAQPRSAQLRSAQGGTR